MSGRAAFRKARLPGIEGAKWPAVASFLREPREVEPHDMANQVGISKEQAFALLVCLGSDGLALNLLVIFHSCEKFEMACGTVPFADGPPRLPWKCGACGECVEDPNELAFRIQSKTLSRIDID